MALRFLPVVAVDRHFGQRQPGFQVVGVLFHHQQILAVGFCKLTPLALDAGIGQAGVQMLAVQLEDIAELDQGTVHIALFQQRDAGLIVLFGPLLGIVTGRKAKGRHDHQSGQQAGGFMKAHGERSSRWLLFQTSPRRSTVP